MNVAVAFDGVRRRAPHDLRRTCARRCHLAGGELDQIQFLLGHVSIQTTERYLGCKQKLRVAVNDRVGIEPDARDRYCRQADASVRPGRLSGTDKDLARETRGLAAAEPRVMQVGLIQRGIPTDGWNDRLFSNFASLQRRDDSAACYEACGNCEFRLVSLLLVRQQHCGSRCRPNALR
jgi:hypothetical protein